MVVCKRSGEAVKVEKDSSSTACIHWSNLFVNQGTAMQIRESLIAGLERETWPELGKSAIDWRDVIDRSVYGQGKGLRMLHTPKATKCPACKSTSTEPCDTSATTTAT